MAVPRRVLEMNLPREWENAFCEDAPTAIFLWRHKLKLRCVPQATLVNQERTTVAACFQFISRQMLIFRLYHPFWWPLFLGIVFATVVRLTNLVLIAKSLLSGDAVMFFVLASIYLIMPMVARYEARKLYLAVQTALLETGRQIPTNPLPDLVLFLCAELLAVGSALAAAFARFAKWRGITYRISRGRKIRMIAYRPFVAASPTPLTQYESVG